MPAAATATIPRSRIGKGTLGSLLPTYSMLLSFVSWPLPPRGLGGSVAFLFEGGSGFPVGMVFDIRANGGFEWSDTRITPDSCLSLLQILLGRMTRSQIRGLPEEI